MKLSLRILLTVCVVITSLAWPGAPQVAQAQAGTVCDPAIGCVDAYLFPITVIGDFYLDGNLIAAGVNSARLTGTPGAPHVVEVKNIKDTATAGAGDVYVYPDQKQENVTLWAGRIVWARFFPVKSYLKGYLEIFCSPRGRKPADSAACRPTIDGAPQADIAPNARATYPLAAGAHTVHTELVGDQANNWSPIARDDAVTVYAGGVYPQTMRLSATFTLKGLLKISLWPKGLVADLFVDGAQVATQGAAADVYVNAGAHTVEARTVTDPAANGLYTYGNMSQTARAYSAGTSFINLYPPKTWLYGFVAVTCQINRKGATDDAYCVVSADGNQLGTVAAWQRGTFNLPVGAHSLSVAVGGASAANWDGPVNTTLTIYGGRTNYFYARFNLKPAAVPGTTPAASGKPGINHLGTEKVVIADYFPWWTPSVFNGTLTWDVPAAGGYNSDDDGTIRRQVSEAQRACLDGFAYHWYGALDSRTTNNFNKLLSASGGTNLRHSVIILTNILPNITEQNIIDSINYVKANWGQNGNYLRLGGRPVLIFTNMERPWGTDAAALAAWTRIRAASDPNHEMIWMAEGLKTVYNPLFDGLYVYRIDHRDYPQSWLKQKRWADQLRAVETWNAGKLPLGGLYFADTIAPGFDDLLSVNAPSDLRSPAPPFARDRRNGGYYADTFAATANTGGDFLFVKSYNEWIEGTEIEPGTKYGDTYLTLTCQYAQAYRAR